MYLKKILLFIVIAGLVGGGLFAYKVYNAIFTPNTSFNNDEAFIYIPSDATFEDVKGSLQPLLTDLETFDQIAQRKGYASNIKAGKYGIKKGMNNNEIINTLRSNNLPIKLAFNNQERLQDLKSKKPLFS